MPSEYTTRHGFEKQGTGENINAWGERLNNALDLVDESISGRAEISLTGNYTLDNTLNESNEMRRAVLIFTDGGLTAAPTVIIRDVERQYFVENRGATYAITFTAGGTTGSVPAGATAWVTCDGYNVKVFDPLSTAIDRNGLIRFDTSQSLTAAQKDQGQINIGLTPQVTTFAALATTLLISTRVWVQEYASGTGKGGAYYKYVASEPTHALKKARLAGGWWELDAPGFLSTFQAGALGTGTDDDSAAVQRWVDYCIAKRVTGTAPAAKFLLNTAVTKTLTGTEVVDFRGAGKGNTEFIVPSSNTVGGILLDSTTRTTDCTYRDFTVTKRGQGGTGLRYSMPEGGVLHRRSLTCIGVTVRGENTTSDYFDRFFDFTGSWRPFLQDVLADGPWVGVDNTTASLRFAADSGFCLNGCYGPYLDKVYAWGQKYAVKSEMYIANITSFADAGGGVTTVTCATDASVFSGRLPFSDGTSVIIAGTSNYNGTYAITKTGDWTFTIVKAYAGTETGTTYQSTGAESFFMHHFNLNGCRQGLRYIRPAGREPQLFIDDGHINYRDDGIYIDGAKSVVATKTLYYNEDTGGEYSGDAKDIHLVNASQYILEGNIFDQVGNPDRYNVFVQSAASGAGDIAIIDNNIFKANGKGAIYLGVSTDDVFVGDGNQFVGTYSVAAVYDGSGNAVLQKKQFSTDEGTWTPVLSFGGASTGITGTLTGRYKISGGRMDYIIDVALTSKGTATGVAALTIPANSVIPGGEFPVASYGYGTMTFYTGMASVASPVVRPLGGGSIRLANQNATSIGSMTDTNFTNTSTFVIAGVCYLDEP